MEKVKNLDGFVAGVAEPSLKLTTPALLDMQAAICNGFPLPVVK